MEIQKENIQAVKVPIVFLPVYEDLLSLKEVIESLFETTSVPFELLIIESGSKDGAKEYCDLLPKLYPHRKIEIIHTEKEGALKAYNQAFKISAKREQDIYMTQTDAIHFKFKNDWLLELIKYRYTFKDTGCVVMGNSWGVCQGRYIEGMRWPGFWGIYIPFETCKEMGGFDESYEIGDAVDIDWGYRLYLKGLKVYTANCFNDHHHQTAHVNEQRNDLEDIRKRNGELFKRKYNL